MLRIGQCNDFVTLSQQIERSVRQAATSSGVRVRKVHKEFEIEGDTDHIDRFHKRLGK